MKKILLIIIGIFILITPCFAANNEKQIKDERVIQGILNSPAGRLSRHYVSFKEDYDLYKTGDKTSVYYSIIKLEEKYKNKTDIKSKLNIEYIESSKELYKFLVNYPSDKSMSTKFVEDFEAKKIVIPDNIYDDLDEDLTMMITLINVYK